MAYNNNINEMQIKQKIKSIVQTYRSLGLMSDSDIKINEVDVEENGIYQVTGEYHYKSLFPRDMNQGGNESGIFKIRLDSNLQHQGVKITPDAKN